jgi:hypothetical protein
MRLISRSFLERSIRAGLCVLLVLGVPGAGASESYKPQPEHFSINRVRAHLYYQHSGRFDDFDAFDQSKVLRNAFIGGGDAKEPSAVTLVLVDVGGPLRKVESAKLQLTARSDERTYPSQMVELDLLFSEDGTITVPFLLYGANCSPLQLEVALKDIPEAVPTFRKEIPFICGE